MRLFKKSLFGFTLTEAIVALGIFAFAIVGLGLALNQILEAGHMSRQESFARQVIDKHLAEIQARPTLEAASLTHPRTERGITLYEEIEPLTSVESTDGQTLDHLWKIRLIASWKEGEKNSEQIAEVVVYKR